MMRLAIFSFLLIAFVALDVVMATNPNTVTCPANELGFSLQCSRVSGCCASPDGSGSYYCCEAKGGGDSNRVVAQRQEGGDVDGAGHEGRHSERFVAYASGYQIDWTLLILGLIISVVVSIVLSFLCCLLCNGCWLHRRRNPQMYESVNDSGFYPLCCGFGIPMGTIVFSSHPPQFRHDDGEMYHGSSSSSLPSSRNRVRFNEDGTPRGVLKNGGNNNPYFHDTV